MEINNHSGVDVPILVGMSALGVAGRIACFLRAHHMDPEVAHFGANVEVVFPTAPNDLVRIVGP